MRNSYYAEGRIKSVMVRRDFYSIIFATIILTYLTIHPFPTQDRNVNAQAPNIPPDEYEPDDDYDQRTQIAINETQTHSIHNEYDNDHFNVILPRYLLVTISIQTPITLFFEGFENLAEISKTISTPIDSIEIYMNSNMDNFFNILSAHMIVESYNISIIGEVLGDTHNHNPNDSLDADFDLPYSGYINVTDLYGTNWYKFSIPSLSTIRIEFTTMYEYDSILGIIYDNNFTEIASSYFHRLESGWRTTILEKLSMGNYFLSVTYDKAVTRYSRPVLYNLTITTNISTFQQTEKGHTGSYWTDSFGTRFDLGQRIYVSYGTILENDTSEIVIDSVEQGAFQVELQSWPRNTANFSITSLNLQYNNSTDYYFIPSDELNIEIQALNESLDYVLTLTQEIGDRYEYRESEQEPTELNVQQFNRYSELSIHYPYDIDHFAFYPKDNGTLILTIRYTTELNVTFFGDTGVVNSTVTRDHYDSALGVNEMEIQVPGVTTSGIFIRISLDDPNDLFSAYGLFPVQDPDPWINTLSSSSIDNQGRRGGSGFIAIDIRFAWLGLLVIVCKRKIFQVTSYR